MNCKYKIKTSEKITFLEDSKTPNIECEEKISMEIKRKYCSYSQFAERLQYIRASSTSAAKGAP
jgi:hypothetical protein